MSGEKAKMTLDAVGGLLVLIGATCLPDDDTGRQIKQLFNDYQEAVGVAKDAINIMDDKINIENRGE
jgi:hypothetical protein